MSNKIDSNVATCKRMASAGVTAVPVTSLPYPDLDSRTAKAVGGHIETAPFFGRRIRLSEAFIRSAKDARP